MTSKFDGLSFEARNRLILLDLIKVQGITEDEIEDTELGYTQIDTVDPASGKKIKYLCLQISILKKKLREKLT